MSEMMATVFICPQCSAPVKRGSRTCERCYSEYIVTPTHSLKGHLESLEKKIRSQMSATGENAELLSAMGICQMQRGLYKFANSYFEKAIALLPESGETYYYAAIALLGGKRPFLSSLPIIRQAVEYLEIAQGILPTEGAYFFLQHLFHLDYFEKRKLSCRPSAAELLATAHQCGISDADCDEISAMVGMKPAA